MFKKIVSSIVGDPNKKIINNLRPTIAEVNALELDLKALSNGALREHSLALKERVIDGVKLDDVLAEAYALVREASRRTIVLRHYDVQIMGGVLLHQGEVVEMRTGEGKTLVATLPLYLNALEGKGVHLVTVNEYLARRDGGWMGKIFHLLGLSVGVIGPQGMSALFDPEYVNPGAELEDERLVHWVRCSRRQAYQADITYGISSEFGFDYLRDNMAVRPSQLVQRDLHYAIIDEVDNILIDEARTPLIISGQVDKSSDDYKRFSGFVLGLRRNTAEEDEEPNGDFDLDEKSRTISLTEQGLTKVEGRIPEMNPEAGDSLYDPRFHHLTYYLDNALRAQYLFKRDVDYVVEGDDVIIVDDFTGRLMPGRRYSEGLHEAIEAKENVNVKRETQTVATITLQNYFRLYDKLAGMTGTALSDAEEFDKIYELAVTPLPTNIEYVIESGQRDLEIRRDKMDGAEVVVYVERATGQAAFFKRLDYADQIYGTEDAKDKAIIAEIKRTYEAGRPVLVGTTSVEHSEVVSRLLKTEKIEHAVLNAKRNESEALIVAQAGRKGAVTISTNMAGRGTDILLGGNAEGLAADWLNKQMFSDELLSELAKQLFGSGEAAARALVNKRKDKLGEVLIHKLLDIKAELDSSLESIGRIGINRHVALGLRRNIGAAKLLLLEGESTSVVPSAQTEVEEPETEDDEFDEADNDSSSTGENETESDESADSGVDVDESEQIDLPITTPDIDVPEESIWQPTQPVDTLDAMVEVMRLVARDHRRARSYVERLRLADEDTIPADDLPPADIAIVDEGIRLYRRYLGYQEAARGKIEAEYVAALLFGEHYNARAALIRAVLAGESQEKIHQIAGQFPGLLAMAEPIRKIQEQTEQERTEVRNSGGMHVIGSERHESRRIDNQLRGRAARQGDPGSSRFFLSLEDDLMRRFGGERLKSVMARINVPEDMPIEYGLLDRIIEDSQKRIEGYNFDARKNVVEYDDVMSKQREAIYKERRAILTSKLDDLDQKVEAAFEQAIKELIDHYIDNYPGFIRGEVERIVGDFTTDATNTVNVAAVLPRLGPVLPLVAELDRAELERSSPERLIAKLSSLAHEQERQGTNLLQLLQAMSRFLPLMPPPPALGSLASHKSGQFQTREKLRVGYVAQVKTLYNEFLEEYIEQADREPMWNEAEAAISRAFNQFSLDGLSMRNQGERQKRFNTELDEALRNLLLRSLEELNGEQITAALKKYIDRQQEKWSRNIGARDYRDYVRTILLSAIDDEWRDYLTAMDDLRREIGLQAFGQRDPKIEYKKRSFEMFTEMQHNIDSHVSEWFFTRILTHRQMVLQQRAALEETRRMEKAGYRVVRREQGKGKGLETRRELAKIGRNDPCFCGSGKKFKYCHGREQASGNGQPTKPVKGGKKSPKAKQK